MNNQNNIKINISNELANFSYDIKSNKNVPLDIHINLNGHIVTINREDHNQESKIFSFDTKNYTILDNHDDIKKIN